MNYSYVNHDAVAHLIKTQQAGKDYQIVDVRDDDFRGGNIPGAINAPSELRTDETVAQLVENLAHVPTVIFHCTLSQVRGPKNARIYAEAVAARDAAAAPPPTADSSCTPAAAASESATQTFSPNPFPNHDGIRQRVLVLRDGFSNWQGLYRDDPLLVENFDDRIWRDFSP